MPIIARTRSILSDARLYLRQISDDLYGQPISLLSDATIGQHTRHLLEFYQCLLAQMDHGQVNYDERRRDSQLEESTATALTAIDEIEGALSQLTSKAPLTVCGTATGGERVATNVDRELLYNLEHSIHHLAIIKIGLKLVAPMIELPSTFGVAPSTLENRHRVLSN